MLLNRFDQFDVISEDSFAEELLFKIEKNFGNFKTLQDRAFPLLNDIVQLYVDHSNLEPTQLVIECFSISN